ncbi:MAG: hypothetical protein IJJ26_03300, partial [Victivallales bacterium]|nr:hypothetical protein [Victivallales bacterium]
RPRGGGLPSVYSVCSVDFKRVLQLSPFIEKTMSLIYPQFPLLQEPSLGSTCFWHYIIEEAS